MRANPRSSFADLCSRGLNPPHQPLHKPSTTMPPKPTPPSSSAADRARRAANRAGSAPATDSLASSAQDALPAITESPPAATEGSVAQTVEPTAPGEISSSSAAPAAPELANDKVAAAAPIPAAGTIDNTAAPQRAVDDGAPAAPNTETTVPTSPVAPAAAPTQPPIVIDIDTPTPAPAQLSVIDVDAPADRPATPIPRREDFPPLPEPGPQSMSHAEKRKNKDKGKAKAKETAPAPPPARDESPDVDLMDLMRPDSPARPRHDEDAASLARGIAMSLGFPTDMDNGASSSSHRIASTVAASLANPNSGSTSSRRPNTGAPDSPSKRQRANTAGRAIPVPALAPLPEERRRPDYGTVDGLPPRGSSTPVPRGGFRAGVGITSTALYRNLPAQQLRQWDEQPHPKLTAFMAGGNGDRIQTAERVRRLIADRFNMDPASVLVGPPGLAENAGPDPIAWLIGGLPLEQAQVLHDEGALIADGHATYFLPYQPHISDYIGTFHGLTIPANNPDLALTVIAGAIADDPLIARHVRAHRDAFSAHLTADEAFARFTESIYVASLPLLSPRGPFTAWNVYVRPHTTHEDVFADFLALVRELTITTPFNGQGRIYRPLLCHLCRSIDHPTNLCVNPNTPGYMGPTAESISALEDISRDALTGGRTNKFQRGKSAKGGNGGGGNGGGKGKGKDREDHKGGNGRRK
ncbi:hypothetical protein FB451DRAFT_1226688 [Mycena latifolia]|nr:hypothetical protein FB451DRAFT_1226688 [Mycena latifolia]